jgi:SOS response regulatory protein OraA/RecX
MTCVRCNQERSHHDCPACGSYLCDACCLLALREAEAELQACADAPPMSEEAIEETLRYVLNRKWQEAKR